MLKLVKLLLMVEWKSEGPHYDARMHWIPPLPLALAAPNHVPCLVQLLSSQ